MSKTLIKWGALTGALVLTIFAISLPFRHSQGFELFAASTSSDPLHPLEKVAVTEPANSVPEAIASAGLKYYPEDKISVLPDPNLGIGSFIAITRALPVTVVDGRRRYTARTWQLNVGDFINEKSLGLGQEDRVSPSVETKLTKDMTIVIIRVARTNVVEKEKIAYQIIEKDDDTMWRGETKVSQTGSNGERTKTYLVIREDGELKSKTLISNVVSTPVVNKIILKGTKLKIGKTFTGKSTFYRNSYGTKVAMDVLKKGATVRITNLLTGKSIIVVNDGCICDGSGVLVDLAPEYFQQLGGKLADGVMPSVKVEEVLNP